MSCDENLSCKAEKHIMDDKSIKAKKIISEYLRTNRIDNIDFDVYITWFSKTLQNWKALIVTDIPYDNSYYEITYNGNKKEAYVDVYSKTSNTVIKD